MVVLGGLLAAGLALFWLFRAPERPTPWGLQGTAPDGKTLTINWVRGDPHCFQLERIEKEESPSRVTLTVIVERCRGDSNDIYTEDESEVRLDEPIGARMLIDGCTGETPPPARDLHERFKQLVGARLDPDDPFAKPVGDRCPAPPQKRERRVATTLAGGRRRAGDVR
jgi:hypothetical protein